MLHAKLKTATRPHHASLDAGLARTLMSTDLTTDGYADVLAGMLGFVAPWEDAAAAVTAEALPGFVDARRKAGLLRADLLALGRAELSTQADADLPVLRTLSAALGSMYVMEGSTLGGRVIAPRVRERLGLPAGVGTAYFESYGPAVTQQWQAFLKTLESAVPEADHAQAVDAACATFAGLERWLRRCNTIPDPHAGEAVLTL